MALVIKSVVVGSEPTATTLATIKDGEYVGGEALRAEFESYPLDEPGVEAALADVYTGFGLHATLVPDEEVDLDDYRDLGVD